jgi:hypothetical protein
MNKTTFAAAGALAAATLMTTGVATAKNFGDWMNPSKWFGGDRDYYDRDYYYGRYGAPGWGGYGYPGWGGYGYPGWGGYGYPGWGYPYPQQQAAPASNNPPAPPPAPQ